MRATIFWGLVPLCCFFLNCTETIAPPSDDLTAEPGVVEQALGPCATDADCDIADYNTAIQACFAGESLVCDTEILRCVGEFDMDCLSSALAENTEVLCDDGLDNDLDGLPDCWDVNCAGATCDDGNQCTLEAECVYGGLEGGTCQQVTPDPDATPCSDGQYCTVGDACLTGECVPGGPRDCSSMDEECAEGACDEVGDTCFADPEPMNGASCDDGVFCTPDDACDAGACVGLGETDCGHLDELCGLGVCDLDADECQLDTAAADGTECEDEIVCTTGALCEAGSCLAYTGDHTMCDDGIASTFDLCYGALYWLLGPEFEPAYMDDDGCVACGTDPREEGGFVCSLVVEANFELLCDDAIDNDGDGLVDCDDPECDGDPFCDPPAPPESLCDDDVDNDGDGDTDCADSDCTDDPVCAPVDGSITITAEPDFTIRATVGLCDAGGNPVGDWITGLTEITWDPIIGEGAVFLALNTAGTIWSPQLDPPADNLNVAFGAADAATIIANCVQDGGVWNCCP